MSGSVTRSLGQCSLSIAHLALTTILRPLVIFTIPFRFRAPAIPLPPSPETPAHSVRDGSGGAT